MRIHPHKGLNKVVAISVSKRVSYCSYSYTPPCPLPIVGQKYHSLWLIRQWGLILSTLSITFLFNVAPPYNPLLSLRLYFVFTIIIAITIRSPIDFEFFQLQAVKTHSRYVLFHTRIFHRAVIKYSPCSSQKTFVPLNATVEGISNISQKAESQNVQSQRRLENSWPRLHSS